MSFYCGGLVLITCNKQRIKRLPPLPNPCVAIRVHDPNQVRFGLVPRSEGPTLGHAWPGAAHINIGSGSHLYSRHHTLSLTEYTHLMPLNNLNYLSDLNHNTMPGNECHVMPLLREGTKLLKPKVSIIKNDSGYIESSLTIEFF
jgi:hypothetical protein